MAKHIIDVRDPEKFEQQHAEGATNLPHTSILEGKLPEISKDEPVVLYCSTGNKAAKMADEFKKAGFNNVTCTSLPELSRD